MSYCSKPEDLEPFPGQSLSRAMGPSCVSASTERKPKTWKKIHTAGEADLGSERKAFWKLKWRIRGADGTEPGKGKFGH